MKISKGDVFKLIFLVLFFIGTIYLSRIDDQEFKTINKEFFQNFNESFSGVITDIKEERGTHTCMLFIHLDSSTTKYFDIRSKTKYYYCVIKGDSAEVIDGIKYGHEAEPENWIRVGDRIVFDGKKDSTYLYHKGRLIMSWKPYISNFSLVQIRLHHRL